MKFFIINSSKKFIKDESGTFAVIFAVILSSFLALAGAAVDYSQASSIKMQMQKSADAAAIAGGRALGEDEDDSYKKIVEKIYRQNMMNSGFALNTDLKVKETDEGTLRVSAKTTMPTTFLKLVGIEKLDVAIISEVTVAIKNIELSLVLDASGSMGGSVASLKEAVTNLINTLMTSKPNEKVKIGMVPFAQEVRLPMKTSKLVGLYGSVVVTNPVRSIPGILYPKGGNYSGCLRSRLEPADEVDGGYKSNPAKGYLSYVCALPGITPLSAKRDDLLEGIKKYKAGGGTYIPSGLIWGWNLLSDQIPFDEARPYDEENRKVLILMTDGENTWPPHYKGMKGIGTESLLNFMNKKTSQICENIKEKKIIVYSITFTNLSQRAKKVVKDCSGNGGKYYEIRKASEFDRVFKEITKDLVSLRLVR